MASTSTKETPSLHRPASRASIEYLGQRHRDIFTRALSNVLSTPAAELAFAQIIDGAPLSQTANEVRNRILPKGHPVRKQHPEICPGVLEKTKDIRTTLDIRVLPFDFQIFGGVVLFDRREPSQREAHEDPNAIFFHSYAENVTYRIWRLLDTQKKQLLEFLLSDNDANGHTGRAPNPFPILPDRTNLTRIDPEEPIHKTGVYRDLWERKPLSDSDGDSRRHCCAFNTMDYPSRIDFERSRERALTRRYEIDDRWEKQIEAEMEEKELAAMSEQQEEDGGEVARVLTADK